MKISDSKSSVSPLLVLGHAVNDTYSNMLSGILPVLTGLFDLSYLLAGLLVMVFNLTSSLIQPLIGRWFDRTQAGWILETGLALNCIGMSMVGVSPSYLVAFFLIGTAGLGAAMFHPPAVTAVIRSGSSSKGSSMGIFLSGGNTGFFLGPFVAGLLISGYGLRGTLIMLPIGLVTATLLYGARRSFSSHPADTVTQDRPTDKHLLTLLASITAFRSIAIQTAVAFLPLYFIARGDSLVLATAIASIWLGAGVAGQIVGGYMSDRMGRRTVIVTSLLAGAMLFYGFLATNGLLSLLMLTLSGATLYASWSVIVVMSSEAAPSNVGAVSGFMLGFSFGIGGLAAVGFGAIADLVGLTPAFYMIMASSIIGGLLALLLPQRVSIVSQP